MGVLPSQTIRELIRTGFIDGIDDEYVNPASLDLPVADEAYRLERTFMPMEGEAVREMLSWAGATPHPFSAPLEVGVSYLVRTAGCINLMKHVYAYANPKSSTGRINVLTRLLADKVQMYDALTRGWCGELWILVQPRSFPVLLSPGIALAQLRFFDAQSFLDQTHLEIVAKEHGVFFNSRGSKLPLESVRRHADSLFLTIRAEEGIVGWKCSGTDKVLDLRRSAGDDRYEPEAFGFEPVWAVDGAVTLVPGVFYILTTDERVKVPLSCSAELRAIDPRLGEFRSHAAGYIDPGWGCSEDGSGKGRPITLEVMTSEVGAHPLRHGQTVARIRYEKMAEAPSVSYDNAASNYTGQFKAQLSKHFKV